MLSNATRAGQANYGQAAGDAIAGGVSGATWTHTGGGWRFCGMDLDQCKDACVALGDCADPPRRLGSHMTRILIHRNSDV